MLASFSWRCVEFRGLYSKIWVASRSMIAALLWHWQIQASEPELLLLWFTQSLSNCDFGEHGCLPSSPSCGCAFFITPISSRGPEASPYTAPRHRRWFGFRHHRQYSQVVPRPWRLVTLLRSARAWCAFKSTIETTPRNGPRNSAAATRQPTS